jgi:biotin transporter BioY
LTGFMKFRLLVAALCLFAAASWLIRGDLGPIAACLSLLFVALVGYRLERRGGSLLGCLRKR